MTEHQAVARTMAQAALLYKAGYNCAESALGAVAHGIGYTPPPLRIATGFGGGVGRTGNICGAVSGAVMAIGWIVGRDLPDDKAAYAKSSATVKGFLEAFQAEHGCLGCAELTGYDFADAEAMSRFGDDQDRKLKCVGFVETAARLAAEALVQSLEVPDA